MTAARVRGLAAELLALARVESAAAASLAPGVAPGVAEYAPLRELLASLQHFQRR